MDSAYYSWLIFAAIGVIVGLFLKPRTVVKIGVVLFVFDIVALFVASRSSHEASTWVFGILGIVIPIVTATTAAGAAIVAAIRRWVSGTEAE